MDYRDNTNDVSPARGGFLRTGHSGVLKVRVDDDLVLDAQQESFDLDRVHKEIDERLPA